MKKLAVIIPVYINDNPIYVKKSVQSLFDQTYTDFHLIIAVDGLLNSNISEYLNTIKNKNVEIIYYKVNKGLAATLNKSIKYAKDAGYEYIARMDADDIAHRERLQKQIEFLDKNLDVSVLGTQAYVIDSTGNVIGIKDSPSHLTLNILKKRSDIIHPSAVFRASFFDKVGYYVENVPPAEDYDLWYRAVKTKEKIISIPERLYYFRYDEKLIERRKNAQKNIIRIKKTHLALYEYYHLLQHYLIRIMPKKLLKAILYRSIKPPKGVDLSNGQ